jgi:hypothetical protein
MSVDDFIKLLLFTVISFSILGISIQFMRILSKLTDMMEDLRTSIKSIGMITEQFTKDYQGISAAINSLSGSIKRINDDIIKPVSNIGKILGQVTSFMKKTPNNN